MKNTLTSIEVWFKIVLVFVFGAFYVAALPYPQESRQFPHLLAVVSLLLTIIALAVDFLRPRAIAGEIGDVDDTELKVLDAPMRVARRKRFQLAWTIILVAAGIGFLGGFLFSAILLFVGFGLAFGKAVHRARDMIVAVALTVLVYFVFGRIMGVPLLAGILW